MDRSLPDPDRKQKGDVTSGSVRLLIACAMIASSASAQTTWGSLHFGMTLAQARAALAGKIVSEQDSPSTPAIMLVAKPVKFGAAYGEPRLTFDRASNKLIKIVWDFSIAANGCFTNYDSKLNAKRVLNVGEIGTRFSERYGPSMKETGAWPTPDQLFDHFVGRKASEQFSSDRVWHVDDQVIRASLRIRCDAVSLLVEYEPAAP